ncbi:MAG: hypothetical protein NZ822_00565 [Patescibacteria group bacterium]|nr:hypothetical protein [Patescibacteria group bacterium]
MKRISITQKEIFEIASFIKNILPNHKIHLRQMGKHLTIEIFSRLDKFKIEEIKTILKIKYPHFQLFFVHRS